MLTPSDKFSVCCAITCTTVVPLLTRLACATAVHNISKVDLDILQLPVVVGEEDGQTDPDELWIAVLVHPNGMRKVLAETDPYKHEWQAIGVLLRMLRLEARKKLFGHRDFGMKVIRREETGS